MRFRDEPDKRKQQREREEAAELIRRLQMPLIHTFPRLSLAEIRRAFEPLQDKCPPVLTLEQAAEIANLTPGTLKKKVSEGAFKDSVKRGKPLLFWRDLFVQELMKG
jgi:hypothetical protein